HRDETSMLQLDAEQRDRKRRAILCHRTQLRWRGFQLPAFARSIEAFETPEAGFDEAPGVSAFVSDGALRAMITCAARPRLGAATMRLVLARESGEVVGLSLRLPGR